MTELRYRYIAPIGDSPSSPPPADGWQDANPFVDNASYITTFNGDSRYIACPDIAPGASDVVLAYRYQIPSDALPGMSASGGYVDPWQVVPGPYGGQPAGAAGHSIYGATSKGWDGKSPADYQVVTSTDGITWVSTMALRPLESTFGYYEYYLHPTNIPIPKATLVSSTFYLGVRLSNFRYFGFSGWQWTGPVWRITWGVDDNPRRRVFVV